MPKALNWMSIVVTIVTVLYLLLVWSVVFSS